MWSKMISTSVQIKVVTRVGHRRNKGKGRKEGEEEGKGRPA